MKIWTEENPLKSTKSGHITELIKIFSKKVDVIFDLMANYEKQSQVPQPQLLNFKNIKSTEPKDTPKLNKKIWKKLAIFF
jgi:hypothetical protein